MYIKNYFIFIIIIYYIIINYKILILFLNIYKFLFYILHLKFKI